MKIDLKKLIKKILDHRKDPKIFVAVFTILLSCISFGYCDTVSSLINIIDSGNIVLSQNVQNFVSTDSSNYGTYCIKLSNCTQLTGTEDNWCLSSASSAYLFVGLGQNNNTKPSTRLYSSFWGNYNCFSTSNKYPYLNININPNSLGNHYSFDYEIFYLDNLLSTDIPVSDCPICDYSSYENQISVLSGDLLTCQNSVSSCNNNLGLCGSSLNSCYSELGECMNGNFGTGDFQWSALYINDIQHLGKPNIFITIPEEIAWTYTSEGDDFDLNVSGYNVDTEYIENVIDIQNTKPSKDDFNKIVSEVIPLFVPGLIIILFIYFVFRFVKKIF